jgi:hypothetical protein
MDRNDFYFRQKVLEAELDTTFDFVELADQELTLDAGLGQIATGSGIPVSDKATLSDDFDSIRGGIHSGLLITFPGALPQPINNIGVSQGVAHDRLGQRIATGPDSFVDLTAIGDTPIGEYGSTTGGAAVTPPAGQTRIVTLLVLFDRQLLDERIDGNAMSVFYHQPESFFFRAVMGSPSAGTPTPPPGDAESIILADFRVDENDDIISVNYSRRGDWIRTEIGTTGDPVNTGALQVGTFNATGTDFIVRNPREGILRLLRVVGDNLGDLTLHTNNAVPGSPHKAANITFEAPGVNWLDSTSLAARAAGATLTDGTQGAIREMMEDLSRQGAGLDGAGIIGSEARDVGALTGHPSFAIFSIPVGTVSSQIDALATQIESQIVERTIGGGGDSYGDFNTIDFGGDLGATIQAAVNSVPNGNPIKIHVAAGLVGSPLTATTQVNIGTRKVFLHGPSRGTVINANVPGLPFIVDTIAQVVSRLHIENLTFRSTTAGQPAAAISGQFSARNAEFESGLNHATDSAAGQRNYLENCLIKGSTSLLAGSWANTTFTTCVFQVKGPIGSGVWNGTASFSDTLSNALFSRCVFEPESAGSGFSWYFQFADGNQDITFADCVFEDAASGTFAFKCEKTFATAFPARISLVRCTTRTRNGVADLRGCDHVTVVDSTIANVQTTSASIFLCSTDAITNLTIRDNVVQQITHGADTKFFLRMIAPCVIKRSNIVRNTLEDVDVGIEFTRFEQTLITDNTFRSTTAARQRNHIRGAVNWSFADLTIRGNTFSGIQIDSTNQISIDMTNTFDSGNGAKRLQIIDNIFSDIGVAVGGSNNNAIAIAISANSSNAALFTIRGNTIENVQSDGNSIGIQIESVENVQIANNIIKNVGQDTNSLGLAIYGVRVFDADHVSITNNTIDGVASINATGAPSCISVLGTGTQRTLLTITGNQCSDMPGITGFGITVDIGYEKVIVANNNLDLETTVGITGIRVIDGSSGAHGRQININGNQIDGGAKSIEVNLSDTGTQDVQGRVVLQGNNCNGYTNTGIHILGNTSTSDRQRGFSISGNVLFSTAQDIEGIHLTRRVTNAVVIGNSITHTAVSGAVSKAGIRIEDFALNINVVGNQIFVAATNALKRGIFVSDANCANIWITGNHVRMPSSSGIGIEVEDDANDQFAYNNHVFVGGGGVPVRNNGTTGNDPFLLPNFQDNNQSTTPSGLNNITSNITKLI